MINRKNRHCFNCKPPERYPGCHAGCDLYKEDQEIDEEIRQREYNARLYGSDRRINHNMAYRLRRSTKGGIK